METRAIYFCDHCIARLFKRVFSCFLRDGAASPTWMQTSFIPAKLSRKLCHKAEIAA